jgi:hypothetical protein
MLQPIRGMADNPICTCCGAVALFQDRDSQNVLYCPVCAQFAAEKTADFALKSLLVMLKAKSSQKN